MQLSKRGPKCKNQLPFSIPYKLIREKKKKKQQLSKSNPVLLLTMMNDEVLKNYDIHRLGVFVALLLEKSRCYLSIDLSLSKYTITSSSC